jgi:hypothetical protein
VRETSIPRPPRARRRRSRLGRLYAAALVGSGLGCLLALGALSQVNGPRAVVLAALVAAFGALAFGGRRLGAVGPAVADAALAVLLWQAPAWLDPRL